MPAAPQTSAARSRSAVLPVIGSCCWLEVISQKNVKTAIPFALRGEAPGGAWDLAAKRRPRGSRAPEALLQP